jgi:aspartyl-tRNA(Asn)/glutamyl-tRNA(Gln) amidotransferase subunit B
MSAQRATGNGQLPDGYEAVIGLEIHVQLSTRTKMFCGCALSFGDEPNVHTCPVCLAHPGVLPVINEQAVRYALQIALALGSEVAPQSIFHRKNYFYPDNPKGYQISQYDIPLARGGQLAGVRIHRVHLEEDAAKLIHVGESGRIHGSAISLVDFNRGGTPLVEIVTEPDLRGPAEAREWAQLLRTTVKQLEVSDANMEQGSLRCDANVSVRRAGAQALGTKTELKNMNSFRFLERGIAAELERQGTVLEGGDQVEQETFHFDPRTGALTPLRSKEYAHDYRYFPEPDLVPLAPTEAMLRAAREALPELPGQRRERYQAELGLPEVTARQLAFDAELGDYFERALDAARKSAAAEGSAADGGEPRTIANWVTGELVGRLREAGDGEVDPASSKVTPEALAALAGMVESQQVTTGAARQVLATLVAEGGDPAEIVEREGLAQMSDTGELEAIVERAIEAEPGAAEKVKAGNPKAIGPIVGAVMRETKGRADGGEVTRLIRKRLGAS